MRLDTAVRVSHHGGLRDEVRPAWPPRWPQVVARALAAEFGGPAVVLDSGDSFAPWNAAYQAMDRDLGYRSPAQARESFLALQEAA